MNRIAIKRYSGPVWYKSFADVVTDFTTGLQGNRQGGSAALFLYIGNMIRFNVCYRDFLRLHGVDTLVKLLCEQAPVFSRDLKAIDALREEVLEWGVLGNYDIQCLSIHDSFVVHGHSFQDLFDVARSVELYQSCGREAFSSATNTPPKSIHVLCDYMPYPVFDSSDYGDNRIYRNYFFLRKPFSAGDFRTIARLPYQENYCKVSERLDIINEMPMLYYVGDGDTMLLATPKDE